MLKGIQGLIPCYIITYDLMWGEWGLHNFMLSMLSTIWLKLNLKVKK